MLGEHAGDVVVDDDHLVDVPEPLLGEDADRRRAAADAHAVLGGAVDDRRATGLDDQLGATLDRELDGALVAEREHHVAGDAALLLAAAGEMLHPAERQHLGAVLHRGDVTDHLALRPHRRALRPDVAVGIDLHLEAAIAEDTLGDDRHRVDALVLRRHDERRRLVVGIGRARADPGHEHRRVRRFRRPRPSPTGTARRRRSRRPPST